MLDEKFKKRMSSLLGEEYEAFIDAIENKPAVSGARVNTLKCDTAKAKECIGTRLTPLSYADDGFILSDKDGIGSTPWHHAGMIYVQDPGAMATVNALDVLPGWSVLDMCSAPGGKSGQAASKIGDGGFLLSNEYVPKRAKVVVSNFERLGIKNAIVTSLDTGEFSKLFSDFFDLVIADVPCSGEGMFRKSLDAVRDWSEENVLTCANRQKMIIRNAASQVKAGGYLLYSTCTYSLEENEMIIDGFLKEYPSFEIVRVKRELEEVTKDGITFPGEHSKNLNMCRRFYPHISEGEGQFIALLRKTQGGMPTILYKDAAKPLTKEENAAVQKFFDTSLIKAPDGRIAKVGENIVIISHGYPIPPKSVFSAGVLIGTVQKGLLFPSHQFFSAYGHLFLRREELRCGDGRVGKYLSGEEICAESFTDSGFCSVLYEGAVLGGGKASLGKIKNHYPKGLRNKN